MKKPNPKEKAMMDAWKWGHITREQLEQKIGKGRVQELTSAKPRAARVAARFVSGAAVPDPYYKEITRTTKLASTFRIPAKVLYEGGWEYNLAGFADWPSFKRKSKKEQLAWAKEFVGSGIREPVKANLYSDGGLVFSDGHHRVMAGTILDLKIPVKIRLVNVNPDQLPDFLDLWEAGYTRKQYNPQGWKLHSVPPLDVVRKGPNAADEWIMNTPARSASVGTENRVANRWLQARASVPRVLWHGTKGGIDKLKTNLDALYLAFSPHVAGEYASTQRDPTIWRVTLKPSAHLIDLRDLNDPVTREFFDEWQQRETGSFAIPEDKWRATFEAANGWTNIDFSGWALPWLSKKVDGVIVGDSSGGGAGGRGYHHDSVALLNTKALQEATPMKPDQAFKVAGLQQLDIPSAARFMEAAQELELRWYDLEGLTDGSTVILYHGTTKQFDRFDVSKSREELVKDYYGGGIFLTPKKPIAWDYAQANRNIGFDPSLIGELKKVNPNAGDFMERLYKTGRRAAWDELLEVTLPKKYPGIVPHEAVDKYFGSADPNTIEDIAGYLIGSKAYDKPDDDTMEQLMGLMGGNQRTGAPDFLYNDLDELGLDGDKYRPKVYSVAVKGITNPLITKSLAQARRAKSKGYDAVVYYGSQAVGGVPEVAIFDPHKVKILKVET